MLIVCLALSLLTAPPQTASDRAWARVSRIQSQAHALTHRVHAFLPNDASWTAEDDALVSEALDLRAAAKKLALDAAVAGRRHTERYPRTATAPDRETVRLRLTELLCSALIAQLDVIQMAVLDKPDERWRRMLPPACALTEAILQELQGTGLQSNHEANQMHGMREAHPMERGMAQVSAPPAIRLDTGERRGYRSRFGRGACAK